MAVLHNREMDILYAVWATAIDTTMRNSVFYAVCAKAMQVKAHIH
jgi:hypothetical protein